eukprot:11587727-Alexandrium_andersonii.AAC.1
MSASLVGSEMCIRDRPGSVTVTTTAMLRVPLGTALAQAWRLRRAPPPKPRQHPLAQWGPSRARSRVHTS